MNEVLPAAQEGERERPLKPMGHTEVNDTGWDAPVVAKGGGQCQWEATFYCLLSDHSDQGGS